MDMHITGQHIDSDAASGTEDCFVQEELKESETVEALQSLLEANPNDEETAVRVAGRLSGLCGRPGVEAQKAVAALGNLQAQYGESEEVLKELVRGLALLIACTDEMTGFVYKGWLKGLLWGYPKMNDVAAEYIKTDEI